MSLDITELEPLTRNDYRRANGAPMVMIDGKNERYSRPSSFAKPLDDESALTSWKIDRGCIGVAHDRALQARWIAVSDEDRDTKGKLREDSISAGRGAERADIGTALHAMSVRFETDLKFSPPQPYLDSLQAYMNEMTRLNLSTVRSEFHTVNREYRCAGTADRLYEACSPLVAPNGDVLPVGTLIVGDLKTGEKLEYSKAAYAVQLALYAEGEFYDVLTDELVATPPINRDWAIIVHMPADQPGVCEFLWIDLEVGRWGAYLVQQIKLWRKMWRSGEYEMPPVELDTTTTIPNEPSSPGLASTTDGGGSPCFCGRPDDDAVEHQTDAPCFVIPTAVADDLLAGHIEWIRERVTQISGHSGARSELVLRWPAGIPTPKQGIDTMDQVRAILPIIEQIEAKYELGFVPRPPSIQTDGPTHRKGRKNATLSQ